MRIFQKRFITLRLEFGKSVYNKYSKQRDIILETWTDIEREDTKV